MCVQVTAARSGWASLQLHVWKELNVPRTCTSFKVGVALFVWTALLSVFAATDARASVPVGINMAPVYYFNTEWFFVDAMKSSSKWFPQLVSGGPWDTGAYLAQTPDGWPLLAPGQAAACVMFVDIQGNYPGGNYVCLYEGSGSLEFGGDASAVSHTPGRFVVNVQPSNTGIVIRIVASDTNNPIRNVRMIMPGFESTYQTQPFHPLFLERLSNYKSLRFMDWQRTNETNQVNWWDRVLPNYRTQATNNGVAVEHMVKLCNTLGADPWFCMPHTATDEYVREFARLVRDTLNPALHVYIEHSNEVWNGGFAQASYAQQHGLQMGLSGDPYLAGVRYHSLRSVQIFNIWHQEFGAQAGRVVRVLGSQHDNPWIGRQIMDFQNAYQHADVLAVAPYFGYGLGLPDQANSTAAMTVDQILDAAQADMLGNRRNLTIENFNDATWRGLKLVAYEGGQHLVGVGSAMANDLLNSKFWQANRHWRMGDLYHQDLGIWTQAGGDLFVEYSSAGRYTEWGSWGTFEWQNQPVATAPKFSAIQDFIAAGGTAPPKLVQLTGTAVEERLGFNVASAGDINNDGVNDILVSGPRADVASWDGGHVFVYSGTNSALLFYKLGQVAGEQFGYSAIGAGDLNGDGYDDILIGAWANNQNGAEAGKVYVYSGHSKTLMYSLLGASAGERFGFSVARLGDVNGDGHGDFAVGSPGYSGNNGRVSIHSGTNGAVIRYIEALSGGERMGFAVAGVGDVTGDGSPDVLVGAPKGSNAANVQTGRAYVFNGSDGAQYHTRYGESDGAGFGRSVARMGDVDGDGRNDYGIGAYLSSENGHQAGKAYVFSGTGPVLFAQAGAAHHHRFGLALSGIGDVNSDGRADFAVGAHKAGGSGRVYLFAGGSNAVLAVYKGDYQGDKFGHCVSSLGDINGDSRPDFLVGAWGCSGGGFHAGRAYAISGLITQAQSDTMPLAGYDNTEWWLSVTTPMNVEDLLASAPATGGVVSASSDALTASTGSGSIGMTGDLAQGEPGSEAGAEEEFETAAATVTTYVTASPTEISTMVATLLTSQAAQHGLESLELAMATGEVLRNSTVVSPFDAGGVLEVSGYVQGSRGVLVVQVSDGEQVVASDVAQLNGSLVLAMSESAEPQLGDEFELITAGEVRGNFATVYSPVTASGLALKVEVRGEQVVAVVVEASSLGAVAMEDWTATLTSTSDPDAAASSPMPTWIQRAIFLSIGG